MLKFLFAILFFSISEFAAAQLQDNFDDGDFMGSPSWSGDTADFSVNVTGQLQLNAQTAGESFLSIPLPPLAGGAMEWRFFIRENFSPSSSNYGKVYLSSDTSALDGSVHGYFLRFGEALSNDAVELFRQDGTTSISVCRAQDAQIASAFSLGVKVTRDDIGVWTIWLDADGGTDYVPAATGAEGLYEPQGYFGFICTYTSGNRQNFFFDDVYAGALVGDTVLPQLLSITPTDQHSLELRFNEIVEPASAAIVANYTADHQLGVPTLAWRDPVDLSLVHIQFAGSFPDGDSIHIVIQGVEDLAGNAVLSFTDTFVYFPFVPGLLHDVVFTEVMFEPSASSILPDEEFVEILNRSAKALHLENWTISDGSSTALFPDVILLPKEYMILCAEDNTQLFTPYGKVSGLSSFPGLNNDSGDQIVLRNESGEVVDQFHFNNDTYRNSEKDDGGWTLEKIDTGFVCEDAYNWQASLATQGGTPGKVNSVNGHHEDHKAPALLRAYLADSTHVRVTLNKVPDSSTLSEVNNYSFYQKNNFLGHPITVVEETDPAKLLLTLPFVAVHEKYSVRLSGNFRDCPGNHADSNRVVSFAFPQMAVQGDVVINELLYHPKENGVDFVELYNVSEKVLDMKEWRIAEGDYESPDVLLSNERMTDESLLLFPGDYLVLTEDPENIQTMYGVEESSVFFDMPDLPDFNSTEGEIVLLSPDGERMDALVYSDDMHFPLLTNTEGISLERLSPGLPTQSIENWHSSSSGNGFATPGYRNSIWLNEVPFSENIHLEPEVISPDNDGKDDVMLIHIQQEGKLSSGHVSIYSTDGKMIRQLERQSLFGDETTLIWDGCSDQKETAGAGLYIVYGEFFTTDGEVKEFKKVCAVTYK